MCCSREKGQKSHQVQILEPQMVAAGEQVRRLVLKITVGKSGFAPGEVMLLYPPITTPTHCWSMVRWKLGISYTSGPKTTELDSWIARHDKGEFRESYVEIVHVQNQGRELFPGETFQLYLLDLKAQTFAMEKAPFIAECCLEGNDVKTSDKVGKKRERISQRDSIKRLDAFRNWKLPHDYLQVVPSKAKRLVLALPSVPNSDGEFWLGIKATDKYGNVCPIPAGKVNLFCSSNSLQIPNQIEVESSKLSHRFYHFGKIIEPGSYWIEAEHSCANISGSSNVITTELPKPVLFGDIHGHTYESDGLGSQKQYFLYARDVAFNEFTSLTDHDLFNKKVVKLSEQFNNPGKFITLFGREKSDEQRGHRNIYGIDPEQVYACQGDNIFQQAEDKDLDLLVIPHHTNASTPHHWGPCDLSYHDETFQRLIEICQNRGSFETEKVEWPVIDGGYGSSAQSALGRGMKMGFVGGSDTHRGTPGGPSHPLQPYYNTWGRTTGLTAVFADELTREDLFSGLKQRMAYATTGPRIVAHYSANGQPMGSVLPLSSEVQFEIFAGGTAKLKLVEIIKNNEVEFSKKVENRITTLIWTDNQAQQGDFYYVKIYQKDGHLAYLSPVWIT